MAPRTTSRGSEFSRPRPRRNESNDEGRTPQSWCSRRLCGKTVSPKLEKREGDEEDARLLERDGVLGAGVCGSAKSSRDAVDAHGESARHRRATVSPLATWEGPALSTPENESTTHCERKNSTDLSIFERISSLSLTRTGLPFLAAETTSPRLSE